MISVRFAGSRMRAWAGILIGILSYLTPLASTMLLMLVSGRPLSWSIALAAVLIIGAAVLGTRAK